jgi:Flp pilus assembly protein TadG
MKGMSRFIWKRLRSERGVAALEFAIVSQLLLLLLYGMLMYGFVFALDHNLTQAAAEGARAAISQTTNITTYAENAARDHLNFGQAKTYANIVATLGNCASDPTVQCITVTITYDNRAHPVLPGFLGMQYLTPSTIGATSTVELD